MPDRTEATDAASLVAVAELVATTIAARRDAPVAPTADERSLAAAIEAFDLSTPRPVTEVAAAMLDLMARHAVRSDHPRYFGLFNPPAQVAAIAGDLVAAAINPQLAVRSHAPAAAAIEDRLIGLFGDLIWPTARAVGTFTSGGSEANHTALIAALARRYPQWAADGVPRSGPRPTIYASSESHLAWIKLARAVGLGADAVRLVTPADGLSLRGGELADAIAQDGNRDPLLVVATAGTTAHGAIDDLAGLADVARRNGAYMHVDAAWAGGALLAPSRRDLLTGIDQADSVTIDPHKWLAVPMGAGLFVACDGRPLCTAFDVVTGYMPATPAERHDPYVRSLQWSRRFIGAKLFAAFAALGLDGYAAMISRQFELGDRLRRGLAAAGWAIRNDTPLPLVCFAPDGADDGAVGLIEQQVVASNEAWISTVRLRGSLALRACITSFETTERDVDRLLAALEQARAGK